MQNDAHKSWPRVGVLIPTHNRMQSLPAALESVLNQTWRDLDVLVVDDASTDGTAAYLAGLSDLRVRTLRLDRQHGAGGARNAGLAQMHNEWIAFQDSDDRWMPDKLEKQMSLVDAGGPDLGLVYCRCRRSSETASYLFPPKHVPVLAGRIFDILLAGNLVTTQTALIRRAYVERVGPFDESLPPLEDWEFFLRLSREATAAFVDESLVEAPFSPDSISQRNHDVIAAFQAILVRYEEEYAARPRVLARHLGTIADRLCLDGRWAEARAHYARAWRLDRGHIAHELGWLLAHWPWAYRRARAWRKRFSAN